MSDPNLFFGQPADAFHLRLEARDIEIGAPDGRGYAQILREYSNVHDAAVKFARGVCEMFITDANWSVTDIEGAAEFFKLIGFEPPPEALLEESEE